MIPFFSREQGAKESSYWYWSHEKYCMLYGAYSVFYKTHRYFIKKLYIRNILNHRIYK